MLKKFWFAFSWLAEDGESFLKRFSAVCVSSFETPVMTWALFFNRVVCFMFSFFLSLFWILVFIRCAVHKSLFAFCSLPLCPNNGVLCCAEAFQFHEAPSVTALGACAISVVFREFSPCWWVQDDAALPLLSTSVFSRMLRSLIQFGVEFCVQGG